MRRYSLGQLGQAFLGQLFPFLGVPDFCIGSDTAFFFFRHQTCGGGDEEWQDKQKIELVRAGCDCLGLTTRNYFNYSEESPAL